MVGDKLPSVRATARGRGPRLERSSSNRSDQMIPGSAPRTTGWTSIGRLLLLGRGVIGGRAVGGALAASRAREWRSFACGPLKCAASATCSPTTFIPVAAHRYVASVVDISSRTGQRNTPKTSSTSLRRPTSTVMHTPAGTLVVTIEEEFAGRAGANPDGTAPLRFARQAAPIDPARPISTSRLLRVPIPFF